MDLSEPLGQLVGGPGLTAFIQRAGNDPDVSSIEDTRFLEFTELGFCLSAEAPDDRVCTVHIYCEATDRYSPFRGRLPFGLQSSFDRAAVRSHLGPPSWSAAEQDTGLLGVQGASDRYDFEKLSVHVQYTLRGDAISLVTLMLPSRVPGVLRDS